MEEEEGEEEGEEEEEEGEEEKVSICYFEIRYIITVLSI